MAAFAKTRAKQMGHGRPPTGACERVMGEGVVMEVAVKHLNGFFLAFCLLSLAHTGKHIKDLRCLFPLVFLVTGVPLTLILKDCVFDWFLNY